MRTSRLKRTAIVILALVNACLLVLLVSRRLQERAARERTVAQLVRLYETNGVSLSPALVPRTAPRPAPAEPPRSLSGEAAFAEAVLGPCVAEEVGGGIYRYVGDGGQCLLRASGAVEAALSREVPDPEGFSESLFAAFGYAALFSDLSEGSGTVVAVRMLPNAMVFNAELALTFSGGRLLSVTGSFVPSAESGDRNSGIDGVTALVRFLDHAVGSGEVCTAVTDVRGGYLLQSTASVSQRLVPVWCVTTDVSQYYVNMTNGEITREA